MHFIVRGVARHMPHGCAGTTYRLAAKEMAGMAEQVGAVKRGLTVNINPHE